MPASSPSLLPLASPERPSLAAVLDARRPMLAAMPEEAILRRARLAPGVAFGIASAVAERLAAFRGPLIAQFGPSAGLLIDDLWASAAAAKQADIELRLAPPPPDLVALRRDVSAAHRLLLTDARSLIHRGHLPPACLDCARDLVGYRATIDSLLKLVAVLRRHWARIEGRGPLTVADVDGAEAAAFRMSAALAERTYGGARSSQAETRVRALSHLIAQYDELRRMMSFLRWKEGDVDDLVPSLFRACGRRGPKKARREEVGAA